MDLKIYVVSHKKVDLPIDGRLYEYIQVGNNNDDFFKVRDNTLDNIADKNANYCELTALYWMWKNTKHDYIGLCHYRRFFLKDSDVKSVDDYFKNVMNYEDVEKIAVQDKTILPKKEHLGESIYEQYVQSHYKKDLIMCKQVISEKYPEYLNAYENVMKSNTPHICNMLVMSKKHFNEYCEWIFGILFTVEQRIDIRKYTPYQKRVYGFLSERLLNVWVEYNKERLNILEAPIINYELIGAKPEKKKFITRVIHKILRTFGKRY